MTGRPVNTPCKDVSLGWLRRLAQSFLSQLADEEQLYERNISHKDTRQSLEGRINMSFSSSKVNSKSLFIQ